MMQAAGYGTYFVTDNMHQFKPSYELCTAASTSSTSSAARPRTTTSRSGPTREDKVDQALMKGNIPAMTGQMRQYFANVEAAQDGGRLVLPAWSSPRPQITWSS